ncbi:MAG: D-alanine--D-alanine ligase [Nanoarchaeota archaeon]|nr:D-alanine--D-alanine ligase [Nanoarchaeota archaeon]
MNWRKLQFEHWPWKVVYFPVFLKYLWYSLLERNLFYFYATNPSIETGGLLIESKYHILEKIPKTYLPAMKLVSLDKIKLTKFPIIIKPNYGERGSSVEKIRNTKEFESYQKNNPHDRNYIIQEYIDLPFEAGVFYYRLPSEKKGRISSLVIKEFLTITGDGTSTIKQLMQQDFRAQEQLLRLQDKFDMNTVLFKGEQLQLEPIGNHCRGTTFLDGTSQITKKLGETFDELAQQIEGFYYGRFDVRAKSFEALERGEFKVLELNGAKAEPAHIYQPQYPVFKAYQSLFFHWKMMRKIARENKKSGVTYPSIKEGIQDYKKYKRFH